MIVFNLIRNVIDEILLMVMKFDQRKGLKNVETHKPILLIEEFQKEQKRNPAASREIADDILGRSTEVEWRRYTSLRTGFAQKIEGQMGIFEGKPYQLGGLDLEIDVLMAVLFAMEQPKILEIGVANGYSSAFIYLALRQVGGSITSIDMPRFSDGSGRKDRVRARLTQRGRIQNTRTLGDLNPGGVIPAEKYGGWLIPLDFRFQVANTMFVGDAFNILPVLPQSHYDVCVFDAMKPYEQRMRCFELVDICLTPAGICFVDGYWANNAFTDFCNLHRYPCWTFGRVGAFKKTDGN